MNFYTSNIEQVSAAVVLCICVVEGTVSNPSRSINYSNNGSVSVNVCLKCTLKSTVILTLEFYSFSISFRLCTRNSIVKQTGASTRHYRTINGTY